MVGKMDFNDARQQGLLDPRAKLDAAQVKQRMADCHRQILDQLLPGGIYVGEEFHCGDISGMPGDSLKLSVRKNKMGVGEDFATGQKFGDLIDVWKAVRGEDYWTALQNIAAFLNIAERMPAPKLQKVSKNQPDMGQPVAQYNYTDAAGVIQLVVYRYEYQENGKRKKAFKIWNAVSHKWEAPKSGRPLYNQTGIADVDTIVLVEGEKAADALIGSGIPATSALSGSNAPTDKTDWSPLAGKQVLIWPDNDATGLSYAQAAAKAALATGATSVGILSLPQDKSEGWDAADACVEGFDIPAFLAQPVETLTPSEEQRGPFHITDWSANRFKTGESKPVEWLVEDVIPMNCAGIFAATGGAGKGMLILDLSLKVAMPGLTGGLLDMKPMAFGHPVTATGAAVIFAAEDDWDELHRRLDRLDPEGRRERPDVRLFPIPLPSASGPMTLFSTSPEGTKTTPLWDMITSELAAIPDLRLVVFDPLACFINVSIDGDNNAAQYILSMFSFMAAQLKISIVLCHHTTKDNGSRGGHKITAMAARNTIRGASALVNGGRWAYVFWTDEKANLREECKWLNIEWEEDFIYKGALVKGNLGGDKTIHTFTRDKKTGLLIDRTHEFRRSVYAHKDQMLDGLVEAVDKAAKAGLPYTKTGANSLYERREELPEPFHKLGRIAFESAIQNLLNNQILVKAAVKGSKTVQWLDVPDGPFALGVGSFAVGTKGAAHEN